MLTQDKVMTHYNASTNTQLKLHPTCENILMCDRHGDSTFFTLCHAPDGMKWLITKVRNLIGKWEWRADAVWVICPECEKITNDFGHCPTNTCYISF